MVDIWSESVSEVDRRRRKTEHSIADRYSEVATTGRPSSPQGYPCVLSPAWCPLSCCRRGYHRNHPSRGFASRGLRRVPLRPLTGATPSGRDFFDKKVPPFRLIRPFQNPGFPGPLFKTIIRLDIRWLESVRASVTPVARRAVADFVAYAIAVDFPEFGAQCSGFGLRVVFGLESSFLGACGRHFRA